MKKLYTFLFACSASVSSIFAVTHTVNTPGLTFTPADLTITLGDTVNFIFNTSHNVVEVSKATWNANGSTPNGGFLLTSQGIIVPTDLDTIWYVCGPHAAAGMKGRIVVQAPTTGLDEQVLRSLNVYPNPASEYILLNGQWNTESALQLEIYNQAGQKVMHRVMGKGKFENYRIDVATLPRGIYFARLNGALVRKFILH